MNRTLALLILLASPGAWGADMDVPAAGEYSLSGSVSGDGMEGVTITLEGDASSTATTDAEGEYSFHDLAYGNYRVTPSKSGYTFDPVSRLVMISGSDVADVRFAATEEPKGDVVVPPMVYVEAGTTPGECVTVSRAFYIGKYEATNAQVGSVFQWAYDNGKVHEDDGELYNSVDDSQCLLDLDDDDCQIGFLDGTFSVDGGKDNYPCVEISWYGAAAYCNYLSESQGLAPAYDMTDASEGSHAHSDWTLIEGADGYRLPTGAQWEYAARGGRDGNDTTYSGGNTFGDVAWHMGNSGGHAHPVGQKDANELDAHDMSGNVWEWCHDRCPGSRGPSRIVRGGSWFSDGAYSFPINCRVSSQYGNTPAYGSIHFYGFRLAAPAGQ